MTSSSSIHVSAGYCRIAIRHDQLRLILWFRARLREFDEVRNHLIAHAALGSYEEHGSLPEQAL